MLFPQMPFNGKILGLRELPSLKNLREPQIFPKGNILEWREVVQQRLAENDLNQPGDHTLLNGGL